MSMFQSSLPVAGERVPFASKCMCTQRLWVALREPRRERDAACK